MLLAPAMTVAVVACSGGSIDGNPQAVGGTPTSSVVPATTSPIPTRPADTTPGPPPSTITPSTITPTLPSTSPPGAGPVAAPGEVCGEVVSQFGDVLPVSVVAGPVDCATAISIAEGYLRDAPTLAQGSAGMLVVDDWLCGRATLDGRAGFEQPTDCVGPDEARHIRIGS